MRFGGYELIEKIGVGGMAEVYRARVVSREGVERTLVIKKILPEHAGNQSFIRMLVAEARVSFRRSSRAASWSASPLSLRDSRR